MYPSVILRLSSPALCVFLRYSRELMKAALSIPGFGLGFLLCRIYMLFI